ncbi:hypothetical protein IE53DRAFT_22784 [Violaceomyces palustris]|uniref:Uncharacterized protein n=1 Tax=Violaceomyces palustris TaxID=1673888 RepID=A0ACD0P1X2_9BASI|nr:hypothetical protein IE53DRAFT_22784 [Violaceomyces palustris]
MTTDKVWALHDFEAENPDEVSFKAGECIIVVEKDDAYGDGWWQGTNPRGETGLFPFTYTTLDRNLALGAGGGAETPDAQGTPQQGNGRSPGVMHTTMADIDNALTELQGNRKEEDLKGSAAGGYGGSRASISSERTADLTNEDGASETYGGSDEYTSRSAARAALAVNAQKNLASAQEKERIEEAKMRALAQKHFEEEEARQKALLEQVEKERKAALAAGKIDLSSKGDKAKDVPISGVDISDESDSEGSVGDLDDFRGAKTHSPLFSAGQNQSSTPSKENGGSRLRNELNASSTSISSPSAKEKVAQTGTGTASSTPQKTLLPNGSTISNQNSPSGRPLSPISSAHGAPAEGKAEDDLGTSVGAATGTATIISSGSAIVPSALPGAETRANVGSSNAKASDERSITSSRGPQSATGDSVAGGTATGTGTAATSLATGGLETPKSVGTGAFISTAQSPSSMKLTSDPTEWTVEQVVEWGRGKGWDEATVLNKFREHEITGDVLLEMDINILKEIDITAFGKRFQVANGIKELKRSMPGGNSLLPSGMTGRSEGASSPTPGTPIDGYAPLGQQPFSGSGPGSVGPQSVNEMYGLNTKMADSSLDGARARQSSSSNHGERTFAGIPEAPQSSAMSYGNSGAGNVAAWQAQQAGQQRTRSVTADPNEGYSRPFDSPSIVERPLSTDDEPLASLAAKQNLSATNASASSRRRSTVSTDDVVAPLPSSPRKRESGGSAGRAVGGGDRTSFFGIGQKNRKPPPKVQGQGSNSYEDDKASKGTFSRLGFARSSKALSTQAQPGQDLKGNISLPTSSPKYDSQGDTARRNRASAGSGGGMGHGRQTSVGSAGPGAVPSDWGATAAGVGAAGAASSASGAGGASEGPVMARIRPVDLEGWMRKKGERYNSWKPRYLALKGSDLVLLRDPSAEKIKGYVSMKGYKVIADENTNPGKYGFKILHEHEKPHYFSSDDPVLVREWMKGLMKATIGRDHSFPVISSYNNATMSLKEAQRMNPPPRPPSPTSRARTQRAKARQNPEQLTARDAAILMNLPSNTAPSGGDM